MNEWQKTEFGRIPEDWNYEPLENFSQLITYGFTNPMPTNLLGPYMLTAKDIYDGRIQYEGARKTTLDAFTNQLTDKSRPKINDVLITKDGSTGRVAIVNKENICISQSVALIRPSKRIIPLFLKYLLESTQYQQLIDIEATGSTIKHIYITKINKMLIGVPDLKTQSEVVDCLHSIQCKIDLLQRNNRTLEQMAETLFRQWFLEEADESWETGKLGDVSLNVRDNIQAEAIEADIAYIGLEHIERKHVALYKYGFAQKIVSNKMIFKKNDILFGKLRPYFHKVCYAPFDGVCSTDILVVRAIDPLFYPFCLFAFFQKEVVDYSDLSSEGTRMPRTSWDVLSKYPINIPGEDTLMRFNAITVPSIEKMKRNQAQIQTLEQLRDTLLPKLMSGEVRVKL